MAEPEASCGCVQGAPPGLGRPVLQQLPLSMVCPACMHETVQLCSSKSLPRASEFLSCTSASVLQW